MQTFETTTICEQFKIHPCRFIGIYGPNCVWRTKVLIIYHHIKIYSLIGGFLLPPPTTTFYIWGIERWRHTFFLITIVSLCHLSRIETGTPLENKLRPMAASLDDTNCKEGLDRSHSLTVCANTVDGEDGEWGEEGRCMPLVNFSWALSWQTLERTIWSLMVASFLFTVGFFPLWIYY